MRHLALSGVAAILWALPGSSIANVPQTGECLHQDPDFGFALQTEISWSGDTAKITQGDTPIEGRVVGLRPHDNAFKLSIMYDDPISGPSEMVIFQIPDDGPPRYRRAIIGYDDLPDGTRVASHVFGFEDITCSVID